MGQAIEIINLDIRDMTCAGCVTSVEKALGGVSGVDLAKVNFTMNRASVHYDSEITNPYSLPSASSIKFSKHSQNFALYVFWRSIHIFSSISFHL